MTTNTQELALTEYNLNNGACSAHALHLRDSHIVDVTQLKGGAVPTLPDFRFCLFHHGGAAHYHILKGRSPLLSGGVCWEEDGKIWQELLKYRNAQLPWVPGSIFSRVPPSELPWSAVLLHLEFATLSNGERGLLEEFRRRLVSLLIHQALGQS